MAVLFSGSALADYLEENQCVATDLSQKFGLPNNQLDRGWCWGFVAQDLMSYAAGRTQDPYATQDVVATTLTTSPEDLNKFASTQNVFDSQMESKTAASLQKHLLLPKKSETPYEKRGNGIHTAIASYSARGRYCSVSKSKLSQPNSTVLEGGDISKPLLDFAAISAQSLVPKSLRAMKRGSVQKKRSLNSDEREFNALLCDGHEFGAEKFARLRAALNDKALEDFKRAVDKACGDREAGPTFIPRTREYDEEAFYNKTVNRDLIENLARGVPVGISYNSAFLKRGSKEGDEYGHASVVVGSRWNARQETCEFKIRNSWGTKCSPYKEEYAKPDNCDNGNIWVKERDVLLHVWSATTVRKN